MPRVPSVVTSVRRELRRLEARMAGLGNGALAATALAMAREIDDTDTPAAAKASCGRVLTNAMLELHQLAAAAGDEGAKDKLDELSERRAARRAGT